MSAFSILWTAFPIIFITYTIVGWMYDFLCKKLGIKSKFRFDKDALLVSFVLGFAWLAFISPTFMRELEWYLQKEDKRAMNALIIQAANCLDAQASWTCGGHSKEIYDDLKKWNPVYVIEAIGRQVLTENRRLQVLFLAIKLGIPNSEEKLLTVLTEHGDKQMAEDYLNSGSVRLREGGELWTKINGYTIHAGAGSHRASWGQY